MKTIDLSPQEWLKLNYNLQIGNRVVTNKRTGVVVNVIETDNIGHFRTDYPVVIVVDYLSGDPERVTIEGIMGF